MDNSKHKGMDMMDGKYLVDTGLRAGGFNPGADSDLGCFWEVSFYE